MNSIINDLIREERIEIISKSDKYFEDFLREEMEGDSRHFNNHGNNFIKFRGKRIIVESSSKDTDFICLRPGSNNSVIKNKGTVFNNGTVILSECYLFLE